MEDEQDDVVCILSRMFISVDSTFEDMRVSKLNSVSHCVDVLLYCHIGCSLSNAGPRNCNNLQRRRDIHRMLSIQGSPVPPGMYGY